MIDTITFRIHKANNYALIENLSRADTGTAIIYTSESNIERAKDKAVRATFYGDSSNFLVWSVRDKLYNASSNYFIGYKVSQIENFVEFEFSLPKYKFGHNIAQLINIYDTGPYSCYNTLLIAVLDFCDKYFNARISLFDIEIRRIDYCYNQFFESKSEALNYLEALKPKMSALSRVNGSVPVPYDSGIHFTTRRNSYKIYHKGTEFKKNDYYKLLVKCPPGHKPDRLLEIADKVLRYEVTYRSSYLNYIFHQTYEKSKALNKQIRDSPYRYFFYQAKILGYKKSISKKIMLSSEYDNFNFNSDLRMAKKQYEKLQDPLNVSFDKIFFDLLYKKFWQLFKKVQVTPSGDSRLFIERLIKYNQDLKAKNLWSSKKVVQINIKRAALWYKISQQSGGLKKAMKSGYISERNYYYILKIFKEMGYDYYNAKKTVQIGATGYGDYKSYFSYLH